jgi:lambda repressor-like predicted transcriptional regulator
MNTPPNNCPPLCGTHTDAEFEQLKAELALEKEKTVGLLGLDIQNDSIIASLRSDAVSLASRLNEASLEHAELRAALAALKAELAEKQQLINHLLTDKDYEGGVQYWVQRFDEMAITALKAESALSASHAQVAAKDDQLARMREFNVGLTARLETSLRLIQQMLDVAENADETGYVTDCGFVDLDKLHAEVRQLLATTATAAQAGKERAT